MLKKRLKGKVITVACLAVVIMLIVILAGQPLIIERYYAEGFYQLLCHILHPLFNLLSFSAGDLFYVAIIIYLIYRALIFIRNIFKGYYAQCGLTLINLLIAVQTIIIIFYLFWGLNYYRPSAAELLKLDTSDFTTTELACVTSSLIDSANKTRALLTVKDFKQSNKNIYQAAIKSITDMGSGPSIFRVYKPYIKPSLLSPLLNYISTSGYYNPFTGEAQINYDIPAFNKPVTACHEIAHQMGFALEDEANFIGFLTCIRSSSNFFKYSAYQLAVGEFMHTLYLRDSVINKSLRLRINPAVRQDFKDERSYWLHYENKAGMLTGIFYDTFLKANNQPKGIESYNDMIILIMALNRKNVHTIR